LKKQQRNSVSAVIVAYNDYEALSVLVRSLSGQVCAIIIIDNSDEGIKVPDTILDNPAVVYRHSNGNKGLAAGLNDGLIIGEKSNFEWMLMLDQDSVVADDMVRCMLNEYCHHPDRSDIGIICPDVFLSDKNIHQSPLQFGSIVVRKVIETSDDVDFSITSGSMIKASLFEEVGLMDESFFIEYIDFDYCLKLRGYGYKILFVKEAVLTHRLGESRRSYVGIRYTYHSPQRVFYQTRNRLIVIRRYGLQYPSFALMQISLFILKFFKILLIEDQKIGRLKFYFSGVLKAIRQQKNINMISGS
jgi:rhamnosyltransferase